MSRAVAASTPKAGAAPAAGIAHGRRPAPTNYLERSEQPLTSLVFVLPLIAFYELGTAWWLTDARGSTEHIIAFSLMQQFFAMLGATGRHLPALAVIGLLLAWHIARNDAWTVDLRTCLAMAGESIAVALPLVLFGRAVYPYLQHVHLAAGKEPIQLGTFVLPIGAGVYEELMFRLVAFTALSFLFRDLLRLGPRTSVLAMVVVSALLFSSYHYLGSEHWAFPTFAFRTIAGVYFGILFLTRGFGVTAGTHAVYDIIVSLLW